MKYIDDFVKALNMVEITPKASNVKMRYEEGFEELFQLLSDAKKKRKAIFICGNGGSAGIAVHMTADFLKNGGLKTHCLYNPATLTCLGNDLNYTHVFDKQLELMACEGDFLIAISSSGKSNNIVNAIETMQNLNGKVITFTGFEENNPVRQMGDYNVYVPILHYGIVESIHTLILQHLVDEIIDRDGIALKME